MLTTERLILRPFANDDIDAIVRMYDHPHVWEYDPGHEPTRQELNDMLQYRIWQYERNGFGAHAVVRTADDAVIGQCGLQMYVWERMPASTPEVELFYRLRRDAWDAGFATEACTTMLGVAFETLRLPRIMSWTQRDNTRSLRLMQRIGMELRAERTNPEFVAGVINNRTVTG